MLATLEDGTLPRNGVFSRSSYNNAIPAMPDAYLAMQRAPRSIYRTHRSPGTTISRSSYMLATVQDGTHPRTHRSAITTTRRSSYILATLEDGTLLGNGVFSRISYNNAIPAMLDAYLAMQHAPRSIYGIPRSAGITGKRCSYMLGTLKDGTLARNCVFSRSSYSNAIPAMLGAYLAMQGAPRSIHDIPRCAGITVRRSSRMLATVEDGTLSRNGVFSRSSYNNAIPAILERYLAMQRAPRSIYSIHRSAGITIRRSRYMLGTLKDGILARNCVFSRSSYSNAIPAMLGAYLAMQRAPRSIYSIHRSARTTIRRSSYILATLEDGTLPTNGVFSRTSYNNAITANVDA
ncbi:hypothetical protein ANTQUA_LOCUS2970 [Anthophora quadrimaculata]